jgi:hypothetical protein
MDDRGIVELVKYVGKNMPEYNLIIGCKPGIYDVDAVLIGNGQLYAIECKHWKGEIEGGTYGRWIKDGQEFGNPLHQARNNAAALKGWLRETAGIRGRMWADALVVFTHGECELRLNMDGKSNTAVTVLLLEELRDWIEGREARIGQETERQIMEYFKALGGDELTVKDREESKASFGLIEVALLAVIVISSILMMTSSQGHAWAAIALFISFLMLVGRVTSSA